MGSDHSAQATQNGLSDTFQVTVTAYGRIVCLRVPHRRLIHPHTVLYEPNPIDLWLFANKYDAWKRNIFFTRYLLVSDAAFDLALCTVILDVAEVRRCTFNGFKCSSLIIY
jgi:hypothetical protein